MKNFHSHIVYDELIEDQPLPKFFPTTKLEVLQSQQKLFKPFVFKRSDNFEEQARSRQKQFYERIKSQKSQKQVNIANGQQIKQSSHFYESDFQEYEESILSSRYARASNNINTTRTIIRNKVNKSAQLPNLNKRNQERKKYYLDSTIKYKFKVQKKNKSNFIKRKEEEISNDKQEQKSLQISTLKKENIKMMNQLHQMKLIYSILIKNSEILKFQRQQIQELKHKQKKIFDPNYELGLDKSLEKLCKQKQNLQSEIIKRNRKFRKKDKLLQKFGKSIISTDLTQIEKPEKISFIRQHYLSKKRQQANNSKKLSQLQKKADKYSEILSASDSKIYLGSYINLQRRKFFLEYDIERKKEEYTEQQQKIGKQIQQLQTEVALIDEKIDNYTKQQAQLAQQKSSKDEKCQITPNNSLKQGKGIILKFFKKKNR